MVPIRFRIPPLARRAFGSGCRSGGQEEQLHCMGRRIGAFVLGSEATSGRPQGIYEGRGPPIRGGLRPERRTISYRRSSALGVRYPGELRLMRGGGRGACRSGLRPGPGSVEASGRL